MLIGAHVSPAGGLPKAIERGVERGCRAIQIFNQSPRMWKPTVYRERGRGRVRARRWPPAPIDAVLIHAVYLLNCASEDREIRAKSLDLARPTRCGRAGNRRVRRGSPPRLGQDRRRRRAVARAGETIREALAESERCPLHLENTAGAGGTLGRSIDELAALLEAGGEGQRLGLCLDSCHLFASGYDVRTSAGMDGLVERDLRKIGLERVGRCT